MGKPWQPWVGRPSAMPSSSYCEWWHFMPHQTDAKVAAVAESRPGIFVYLCSECAEILRAEIEP